MHISKKLAILIQTFVTTAVIFQSYTQTCPHTSPFLMSAYSVISSCNKTVSKRAKLTGIKRPISFNIGHSGWKNANLMRLMLKRISNQVVYCKQMHLNRNALWAEERLNDKRNNGFQLQLYRKGFRIKRGSHCSKNLKARNCKNVGVYNLLWRISWFLSKKLAYNFPTSVSYFCGAGEKVGIFLRNARNFVDLSLFKRFWQKFSETISIEKKY